MKLSYLVLALLAIAFVASSVQAENVVVLTKDNFDSVITENKFVLVEFFAPWCGHCKKLAPEYEKAAGELKELAVLASVDCTVETELAQRFQIQGYPTLKFFKNSELHSDFDGERHAKGIQDWIQKRLEPAVLTVDSKATFDQINERPTLARVIYFADAEADVTFFREAADSAIANEFTFGLVSDPALAKELGQEMDTIVFFYDHQVPTVYTGEKKTSDFIDFLGTKGLPKLETLVLNQAFISRVTMTGRPLVMGFHENADQLEIFRELSQKAVDSFIHFTETPVSAYPELAAQWGASGTKFPTFILTLWNEGRPNFKAWDEELELTAEKALAWIQDCIEGNCKPYKKSQPIPETNDEPVKVIVAKTFDQIVMDETKDVVVEFYAPWCGHCKALEPLYNDVAIMMGPIESVVISKIDATANHIDEKFGIEGFPTLLLFKAHDKQNPVRYEGSRDIPSMINWITENASISVDTALLAGVNTAAKPEDAKDEL